MKINKYWIKKTKRTYTRKNQFNKIYKGSLTKHRKEINSRRAITILLAWCIFAPLYAFAMTHNSYTINGVVVSAEGLNSPSGLYSDETKTASLVERVVTVMVETEKSNEMENWVLNEVRKAGLNVDIAFKIIKCESNWKPEVYGVNNNGTTDFGLWQINSIHKKEISPKERLDYKKATEWAINKRLKDGNWSAWYSSAHCWDK